MAGRVLAFADAELVRMAREDFIAVAGDDWYQRRRQDAEGEFFRKVANQGPRKGQGGSTRQGIYCFTADGKLLMYRNHQDPSVMRQELERALGEWKKLPEAQRRPGATKIADEGKVDAQYGRKLPAGGLVVNVFTRILDRDAKGDFCKGTCTFTGGDQAARDRLWLTAADVQALVRAGAKKGERWPMPAVVAERIARFHLVDDTRGEPPLWEKPHIRSLEMTLAVEEASADTVRLRLDGSALLATAANADKAERGFAVRLLGYIDYDLAKKTIGRFDVVALGEHWGKGTYTSSGARPGKTPLGIVFELSQGDAPADRVPPQAARNLRQYLGAD